MQTGRGPCKQSGCDSHQYPVSKQSKPLVSSKINKQVTHILRGMPLTDIKGGTSISDSRFRNVQIQDQFA